MSDPAPASPPPPIDYAPTGRRRGWWKKYLILALLFAIALWGAHRWPDIQRLYATTQAYMWQRRAMNFTLATGTIVYTEEPAEIQKRLPDRSYFRPRKDGPLFYEPAPLYQMLEWGQRHDGKAPIGPNQSGGIFLHARTQPDGHQRLVAIAVFPFSPAGSNPRFLVLYGGAIQPGTLTRIWQRGTSIALLNLPLKPSDQVTIFAGQVDPSDASHFIIDFARNGEPGIIDGWLRDSSVVELRPRRGDIKSEDQGTPMLIWPDASTDVSNADR